MNIYQRYDGKWILTTGPDAASEIEFETEMEARMTAQQIKYAENLLYKATQLAQLLDGIQDSREVWDARFYGDTMTDADVASLGVTKDDLLGLVYVFNRILDGISAEDKALLNKLRTDL